VQTVAGAADHISRSTKVKSPEMMGSMGHGTEEIDPEGYKAREMLDFISVLFIFYLVLVQTIETPPRCKFPS
jgi:hypothetical protein